MEFNYKKRYGQNFLMDTTIIKKITTLIDIKENDLIIEIGPGNGKLTKELVNYNSYYLAYEIDLETKSYLNKYENDKVKFIYQDILKSNIKEDIKNIKYNNLYIIANLPYYITTPIIEYIINSKINPDKMLLMVQKEVADRLCSSFNSSNYGYFTVLLNYYFTAKKEIEVNRNCFEPIPNVDSTVISLTKKEYQEEIDIMKFTKLIKDAFHLKRKNLRNNLNNYDLTLISDILTKYNLSLNNRAEEIPLEIFIEITNNL